jgi:hypothetical protein
LNLISLNERSNSELKCGKLDIIFSRSYQNIYFFKVIFVIKSTGEVTIIVTIIINMFKIIKMNKY